MIWIDTFKLMFILIKDIFLNWTKYYTFHQNCKWFEYFSSRQIKLILMSLKKTDLNYTWYLDIKKKHIVIYSSIKFYSLWFKTTIGYD